MNLVILCHTLRHRQAQIFKIGASSLAWAWDIFNLKGCQLHPWFQMYVKHAELVSFTPGRGENIGITQFHTQFTYVFKHF